MEEIKTYEHVTIAAPISNREPYLDSYLNCILAQTYPKDFTSIHFLINNSKDQSKAILQQFQREYKYLFKKITLSEYNNKRIPDSKDRMYRVLDSSVYNHLATVRNMVLDNVHTPWLFSVDSDIMLTKNSLTRLMDSGKKVISALVCNGHEFVKTNPGLNPYKFTNAMYLNPSRKYTHFRRSQLKGVIEVDVTGAVMLMHKSVYKKARYSYDEQGEDIPFCRDIKINLRERIYCDSDLKLPHCMNLELLEKYQNKKFKF